MKKLLILSMFLLLICPLYAQWQQVSLDSANMSGQRYNPAPAAFINSDTGFVLFPTFMGTLWTQSVDKGKSWLALDVSEGFTAEEMDYQYGWGLVAGTKNDTAFTELFFDDPESRMGQKFSAYTRFGDLNIVSADKAIFSARTAEGMVIGQLEREGGQLKLGKQFTPKSGVHKIQFINENQGWYLLDDGSLMYTDDFGQSSQRQRDKTYGFDFSSPDSGTCYRYITDGFYFQRTLNGGKDWEIVQRYDVFRFVSVQDMEMNSNWSLYMSVTTGGNNATMQFSHTDLFNAETTSMDDMGTGIGAQHMQWRFYFYSAKQGLLTSAARDIRVTDNNAGFVVGLKPEPNQSQQHLSAYPNPTSNRIRIELPERLDGWLTFFDSQGKQVLSQSISEADTQVQLDLSALAPGLYQLRISGKQSTYSLKILKQ